MVSDKVTVSGNEAVSAGENGTGLKKDELEGNNNNKNGK